MKDLSAITHAPLSASSRAPGARTICDPPSQMSEAHIINAVSVFQRAFYSSVFGVAHAPSIHHKANERESDVVFSPVSFVYADTASVVLF